MNPAIIVSIDTLANAFDECNISGAPLVTIEFAGEADLDRWLNQLHKELITYAQNGIVARPLAGEMNKFNDVLCVFKVRSQ